MQKEFDLERQILENLNISPQDFHQHDLELSPGKTAHYLVFDKTAKTKVNVLVMLHGYLGSSMVFFKMFKVLMQHFYIVSVDLQGFGLSSRHPLTPDSMDLWIQYFTAPVISVLRDLDIHRFNLLGHSLGGMMSAHLLKTIPDRVQRLYLLSPGGMNPAINSEANLKALVKKVNCFKRMLIMWIVNKMFKDKQSPLQASSFKFLRSAVGKLVYGSERLNFTPSQRKLFIPLFKRIFGMKPCGDKCVGYLFHYGVESRRPILPILEEFHGQLPIFLYYGQFDWMDYKKTIENLAERNINLTPKFVPKADHQIMFQNPYATSLFIIKDFLLSRQIVKTREERLDRSKSGAELITEEREHPAVQIPRSLTAFGKEDVENIKLQTDGFQTNEQNLIPAGDTQLDKDMIIQDGPALKTNIQDLSGEIKDTKDDPIIEETNDVSEEQFEAAKAEIDGNPYFDDVRLILREKFELKRIVATDQ